MLNKVTLIGNLGKDPDLRRLENGRAVVSFSLATSETWKDKTTGERMQRTEWHNIVAWGSNAEFADKWLAKGKPIYIEGKLQTRSYEKDGQTHYRTEIVADRFQFLPGGKDQSSNVVEKQEVATKSAEPETEAEDDDDLPF